MRTLFLLLVLALGSCTSVPKAPQLPQEEGYLTPQTTRRLIEHWTGNDYPKQVSGHPIHFENKHSHLPAITGLTPARKFSKDDRTKNRLGTVVMAHDESRPKFKAITDRAWQITSQPATILAHNEANGSLTLSVHDFREDPKLAGLPLAQNHRLPFDYIEEEENRLLSNFLALIDPSGWSDRRGFYLATQYDPKKIPLIFIHGLLSSPLDFEKLSASVARDPELWDRYQLWYYFYPTGDPWILSAAHFRKDFRELAHALDPENDDRNLRRETTIIAHSMGGLISKMSVSEKPEILYQKYFNRPLEEINLPSTQKQHLRQQLLFEPLTEISKIIFLATPHKGSKLAEGPLYWLAKSLIRAPARIVGTTLSTAQMLIFTEPGLLTQNGTALLNGNALSLTQLQSGDVALEALDQMPVRKGVELHNIIATVTGTERGLGDWVVPYGSARLDQAESQFIVRSGHWLIRDPETAERVIELLHEE